MGAARGEQTLDRRRAARSQARNGRAAVGGILLPSHEASAYEPLDDTARRWRTYPQGVRDGADPGMPESREVHQDFELRHGELDLEASGGEPPTVRAASEPSRSHDRLGGRPWSPAHRATPTARTIRALDTIKALADLSGSHGVLAIFVVMLLKESGIPVPVPSDLIMVGAGVQIAAGAYSPLDLVVALVVAVAIGGSIQFLLARTAGRAVVYRVASMVGIGAERLDRAVARLASRGPRAVFIGLNIPGARAAVIPAAGLARLAFLRFTVAAITGSLVFYGWHILLGYFVGPVATELLERNSTPPLAALVILALAGLAGWLWLRQRSAAAARSWTDAACPACLAITALGPR